MAGVLEFWQKLTALNFEVSRDSVRFHRGRVVNQAVFEGYVFSCRLCMKLPP